ncbi:hypothetical protein V1318_18895 [Lysobacter sp. CCNWLW3]|uniref:hypothetical protein n=1 Tax=unclassified Lysobacter TaxID=2635362 RepID=UPI002FD49286
MSVIAPPVDIHGRPVKVGSRVRVLKIAEWLQRQIPANEFARLQSLVGTIQPIDEIDEWGAAWIEAEFPQSADHVYSHSLALDPDEMELVNF